MQSTHTSVLARRVRISDEFATLPYEAGWATEAVFFVQAEGDHSDLAIEVDVSPDGINWIGRGSTTLAASDPLVDLPVDRFGNWLRLRVTGASADSPARILVHVNLKG